MIHKGFKQQNKTYIWNKGNLYRLPFFENKRGYGLLKCKPWRDGFIVGNQRKSLAQLKGMTTDVEVDFQFIESKDPHFYP
jgi:hypothetical protein